ncbi:hypothetical protein C1H46_014929 [Malus baccata]|uniref:Uncharacterized protein n=1 Tax=Malus baccata TaxID=106549 RepID=A0A540MKY4_MALBA|nr:hypothetical protein C1H46_014929 [Malus baccata]
MLTSSARGTPRVEPPCNEHCLQLSNCLASSISPSRAISQRVLLVVEYCLRMGITLCRVLVSGPLLVTSACTWIEYEVFSQNSQKTILTEDLRKSCCTIY